MSPLTGVQLGNLIRQRRYDALAGQCAHSISLDGGATWWEFYFDGMEFAIGGPVDRSRPARDEWNPIHAGLFYAVVEVNPNTMTPGWWCAFQNSVISFSACALVLFNSKLSTAMVAHETLAPQMVKRSIPLSMSVGLKKCFQAGATRSNDLCVRRQCKQLFSFAKILLAEVGR